MRRYLPIAVCTMLFAGCSASTSIDPPSSSSHSEQQVQTAQLAAYAASARYPTDAKPQPINVAALQRGDSLRLINFTDRPLRDINVWVNGTFVKRVDVIPPNGSVTLSKGTFYDNTRRSLSGIQVAANQITIQEGDTLHKALGPVME